jgi:hypothetical protein
MKISKLKFVYLSVLLLGLLSKAMAYRAPVHGATVSGTNNPAGNITLTYAITDPITGHVFSNTIGPVVGAPQSSGIQPKSDGVIYWVKNFSNVFGRFNYLVGASTYDPRQGKWMDYSHWYADAEVYNLAFTDGVLCYYTYTPTNTQMVMATYDPDLGRWVDDSFNVSSTYGGQWIITSGGLVCWTYTNNPALNGGMVGYGIYDPVRKIWKTQILGIPNRGQAILGNGVIYHSYSGVWTPVGYDSVSGTWQFNQTTKAVSAFSVGYSYAANSTSTSRWVTDMSIGATSMLNWGDGASISGSGYHTYANNLQWTLSQSVTDWAGNVTTSSKVINQNKAPVPLISVDQYNSGDILIHPAATNASVTIRYKATDENGDLTGIRYNLWNATNNYFDNGGGGYVAQSGGAGEVIKSITLPSDGDWYFWTDAIDSQGNSSSTGAWTAGLKLTVAQTPTPPDTTISVDDYAYGESVLRPIGGSVTVNVRFRATDINGDLSGIRYNIWNATTGFFDNGGGGFVAQSGGAGEVVRSVALSSSGDWYFWTDAQDAQGHNSSTGAWTAGFKLSVQQAAPELTPDPSAIISNFSARAVAGTGENQLIGGFVLTGSGSKNMIINAKGPSLVPLGVPTAITDPQIYLYGPSGLMGYNNDWGSAPNASLITPFNLATKESSILQNFSAGAYSAQVSNLGTGDISLLEIGDLAVGSSPQMVNFSGRAYTSSGNDVLIAGFIVSGGPKRILIVGKGPSLAASGISAPLLNPVVDIYDQNGALIATNDNWQKAWNSSTISQLPYVPGNSYESAIYIVLPAGNYSAVLSGAYNGTGNGTGVGLLEIYAF